jgi:acyl-CoA reductase-like NAD-dependent aldehyde dehydrogenase
VFEDADLDAAAKKAAWQYDDSGQVCLAGTRLLVQASVRDEFLERFHAYADTHVLGDSRDEATTITPMIHPDHLARVDGFVQRAREAGDRIVRGGKLDRGLWYEPTLIEPASNDSEVVQREIFGPVLTFQTFEDEARRSSSPTRPSTGCRGSSTPPRPERAERVGRAIRAGMCGSTPSSSAT